MKLNALPMIAQVIIGNLFITLPLAFATGYILFEMDRQNTAQQQLISSANQVGRLGYMVEGQLKEIERTTKQLSVLQAEPLKRLLITKQQQLQTSLKTLDSLLPTTTISPDVFETLNSLLERINPILEASQAIDVASPSAIPNSSAEPIEQQLNTLFRDARASALIITQSTQQWVDQQVIRLEQALNETYKNLLILAVAMIPITIMVTLFVSTITTLPIKRLSKAIWHLGEGGWHDPVHIVGPRDLERLGRRLEWLRQQLVQLEQQKETLLRHVTHELKTPLTSIKEASELLFDEVPGPINERQRAVLTLQENNILHLQQLIEQLLSYNVVKSSSGHGQSEVNIREFVEGQRFKLADIALSKQLQWQLKGEETVIKVDEQRLEMALSNVLSNAIKYSPTNGVITISWLVDQQQLVLRVIDRGPGVALEDRNHIFKPFYQGARSVKGAIKGSGIGLAIAQECITTLGGAIQVVDSEQDGACFELRVPIQYTASATQDTPS